MKKRRPTEKKLICCVNPGLSDTRTTVEDARRLSKLDFPTLERPMRAISYEFENWWNGCQANIWGYLPTTATSGKSSGGNDAGVLAPAKNDVKGN